jgi:hypothetical protein
MPQHIRPLYQRLRNRLTHSHPRRRRGRRKPLLNLPILLQNNQPPHRQRPQRANLRRRRLRHLHQHLTLSHTTCPPQDTACPTPRMHRYHTASRHRHSTCHLPSLVTASHHLPCTSLQFPRIPGTPHLSPHRMVTIPIHIHIHRHYHLRCSQYL